MQEEGARACHLLRAILVAMLAPAPAANTKIGSKPRFERAIKARGRGDVTVDSHARTRRPSPSALLVIVYRSGSSLALFRCDWLVRNGVCAAPTVRLCDCRRYKETNPRLVRDVEVVYIHACTVFSTRFSLAENLV